MNHLYCAICGKMMRKNSLTLMEHYYRYHYELPKKGFSKRLKSLLKGGVK